MKKNKIKKKEAILIGLVLGFLFFIIIFGFKTLNPRYDSWLFEGGDLTQHYMGWKYFRISNWNFPLIGLLDGIVYPYKLSIVYMDSIPLFAVIFKILSPILPKTFQYFGLYGLLSYIIMGGVSALIVNKYTAKLEIIMMSTLIILSSPAMIFRVYGHLALSSHWIILIAIYYWLSYRSEKKVLKNSVFWSLLMMLSVSVHMYFVPMVFIILVGFCIDNYIINKKILPNLIIIFSSVLSALLLMSILGIFEIQSTTTPDKLGTYSMNINSFFNPLGISSIIQTLPLRLPTQYEGFAYLGAGIILLLFIAIVSYENINKKIDLKNNIGAIFISISSIILALGPIITLNNHTLIELPHPRLIEIFFGTFRANGRFIWIFYYILIVFIIKTTISRNSDKRVTFILLICMILQYSDIFHHYRSIHRNFKLKFFYSSKLKSKFWNSIEKDNYKIIFFSDSSIINNLSYLWDFSNFAVMNKISLNDIYAARKGDILIEKYRKEVLLNLEKGIVSKDIIYIFPRNSKYINKKISINYYLVDDFVIGTYKKYDEFETYNFDNLEFNASELYGTENTDRTENDIILKKDSIQYGPYVNLEKGTYEITIMGENLDEANFDVLPNSTKVIYQNFKSKTNVVKYTLILNSDTNSLEFRTMNTHNLIQVMVNSIKIKKIK